jgi:N-acetylglucosamine kinase-like BadF-type ATPase
VRDVEGPGANVATLDAQLVTERVTDLVTRLGSIQPSACCAGAAGAEVPEGRARLEWLLGRLLPDCRVSVVHDARLVLAAAGLDSGIALIAGTGSVAYGRAPDGREAQRGGWGWMIGDEGGGVWITREAVRLTTMRADEQSPPGTLGETLLADTGTRDARGLIAALHARREPMEWAALARAVFETADSDAGSRVIIDRAGAELARLVDQVRSVLGVEGPVVLAGGLLLNQIALEEAVRRELGQDCIRLVEPPVEGALRMAEAMLSA